ncbi:thiamine diphosphokinase [Natronospora cellulosivora (SeqCode)]
MQSKKGILALNGELKGKKEEYLSFINNQESFLIAADAGVLLYQKLALSPDVLIGDFDSLDNSILQSYESKGIDVIKYPKEKDETDGELAIKYCIDNDIDEIIIIGSFGGRFDHQLANILLLEYAYHHQINAIIKDIDIEIALISSYKRFDNCQNDILSLIPLDAKVDGIRIEGCRYNVEEESLFRYKSRGISNQIIEERAEVRVDNGLLLYMKSKG